MTLRWSPRTPVVDRRNDAPEGRLTDLFVLACVLMVPLTVAARSLLPARFSYDSDALQHIARGDYVPLEDTSYLYVGRLYSWLGMADHLWAAAALGVLLAAVALHQALVQARHAPTLPALALVGLYAVTASVYLGQFSKDVWVLPVVLVVLLARPGLRGEIAILGAAALYAAFFREYWFAILLIYAGLRVVTYRKLQLRRVVLGVVVAVTGMTVFAPVVLGVRVQEIRESINLDRVLSPDAATAISAPDLGLGVVGDVLENLAVLLQLLVPVPLLTQGSPVYLAYFVAILLVWAMFLRAVTGGPGAVLDGGHQDRGDVRAVRAALFAVAVVTTQSFFEPDYGSYLRHLTPVLPLVIAVTVGRVGAPFLVSRPSPATPATPATGAQGQG